MIVAVLGLVSDVQSYTDKETQEEVEQVYVAAGERMLRVTAAEGQSFVPMDRVLVVGRLRTYNRDIYIQGGSIRIASEEDAAFFKEGTVKADAADKAAVKAQTKAGVAGGLPKGEA